MHPEPGTYRYATLLAVLIGFLLLVSPLSEMGFGFATRAIAYPIVLATCALASGDDRRFGRILIGLSALGILGDIAVLFYQPMIFVILVRLLFASILALMVCVILIRVLRADRVATSSLLGGACAYLLMALAFSTLFEVQELLRPGSFVRAGQAIGDLPNAGPVTGRFLPLVYFSLVTLSTLGYGDIVPANPLAGMTAALEAVMGQLYIAILVGGLVGMRVADRHKA